MSKVQSFYHIIINTKGRRMTLNEGSKKKLYTFMWGVIKNMNTRLIWMNGIPNHLHLLVDLPSSLAISNFVQELKRSSSVWLKESPDFPYFDGWGKEYCAFSKSDKDIDVVKNYIANQVEHHKIHSYEDEMQDIFTKSGLGTWVSEYYD